MKIFKGTPFSYQSQELFIGERLWTDQHELKHQETKAAFSQDTTDQIEIDGIFIRIA